MTQITGQIHQLTNGKTGAQLVNRFPITVMDAVLGLNSYLQNQFSSLADIYMPIEGITESKPLQEFVYRLCPSTIKAKSLTLDRIYGKTLAWNQMIGGKNLSSSTMSYNQETGVFTCTGSGYAEAVADVSSFIAGHRYYMLVNILKDSGEKKIRTIVAQAGGSSALGIGVSVNGAGTYSAVGTSQNSGNVRVLAEYTGSGTIDAQFKCSVYDLTLMFGAGNEPSTVAEFEALYPGYHDYSAGKLISNDAESIETVGFNQWDEECEEGGINANTGETTGSSNQIRSKNYIPVVGGQTYYFFANIYIVCTYDSNRNYLKWVKWNDTASAITLDNDVAYIKFCTISTYGPPYNHDVCINLSDPAKNGTYEPYRKSTMQLGLGSFQVRDSQGNVTTITGGLKSAGSVRDEIIGGSKDIKRIGGVDLGDLDWITGYDSQSNVIFYTEGLSSSIKFPLSDSLVGNIICSIYSPRSRDGEWGFGENMVIAVNRVGHLYVNNYSYTDAAAFKSAMQGVMLYYELATPIEYELVSPLVPTVKAGTTEARISPNADGLSAPMVADMTYDAQANNDSASAQYALTAGRLLNSHKLWGQDFDGTQDVAGALTGVTNITMNGALSGVTNISMSGAISGLTNINSLINISGTNVGIGKTPSVKLDVNGNIKCVEAHFGQSGAAYITEWGNVRVSTNVDTDSWRVHKYNGDTAIAVTNQSGNVGIGTPTPEKKLHVNGDARITGDIIVNSSAYISGNASVSGTLSATGAATFGSTIHADGGIDSNSYITAGAVNSSSDARLKNNITPVVDAMDTIMSLKPSEWIWNEKHHLNGQKGAGLVAQEVEKVLPFAVAKEGEYLALNYYVFHAYEIAGLQDHEERIKALEAENAELRRRLGA